MPWLISFSLGPMHSAISNLRWQMPLRVISALLLVFGLVLIAADLITSFHFLEHLPGQSSLGVAVVARVRLVSLISFIVGAVLLGFSFVVRRPE